MDHKLSRHAKPCTSTKFPLGLYQFNFMRKLKFKIVQKISKFAKSFKIIYILLYFSILI